jgi:hypothetical protein
MDAEHESLSKMVDPIMLVVSREEVEGGDISRPQATFSKLLSSPETIRHFRERLDISFFGYDQDRRELFEIPEVRSFVHKLDEIFPYWLFFLSRYYLGLQCITFCFLPPFLTPESRQRIHTERLMKLMEDRWLPALYHISAAIGLDEQTLEALQKSAAEYFIVGPKRYSQ